MSGAARSLRSLVPLIACGAALLAGCGGDDAQAPAALTIKTTTAASTKTTTTTKAKTTTKATTTATTTAPRKPAPKSKVSVPITCLKQAGLSAASKRGAQLWAAGDAQSHKLVYVDGPYKSVAEAKASAASLESIQTAKQGGVYVVSAALRAKLDAQVDEVATCLEARR